MNPQAQKMINVAMDEVGYREGRSNGSWNNFQKFSPNVPGLEWSQNQAWCHTFLSWCALDAGLSGIYPRTASTDYGYAWFKNRGEWSQTPVPGALGYLGNSRNDMYHVFLVVAVNGTRITTIEGNTNDSGSAQGDGVYKRTRYTTDSAIRGYGIPNFASVPAPVPPAQPKPSPTWQQEMKTSLEGLKKIDLDKRGPATRGKIRNVKQTLNKLIKREKTKEKKR